MSNFLDYFIPFLKFGAIFISALSGILALLVDFKKDGKITKWGRISLLGVVLSFLIASIMQAIEIYKDKQTAIAEQQKTQRILNEISRGIYGINTSEMNFDYEAKIKVSNKFFQTYNKRIWQAFNLYKSNPNLPLPKGTFRFNNTDLSNNKVTLIGLIITPESNLYPSKRLETQTFNLIGQAGLDISIYKKDSLQKDGISSKTPDLSFSTQTIKPELTYSFEDTTIEITAKEIKIDKEDYSWRNKGKIESLLDLSEGNIKFDLSDRIVNELDDEGFKVSNQYLINGFGIKIDNRIFHSFDLCEGYYLKFPKDILQTNLNLKCR